MFNHPGKKNATADLIGSTLKPTEIFKYKEKLSDGNAV